MSHLSSQIVQESGLESENFTKPPRSMRKAGHGVGKWKRSQNTVKITQGILKTSSTHAVYQNLKRQPGGNFQANSDNSPKDNNSLMNQDLQNISQQAYQEMPSNNNVQFVDELQAAKT